MKRERLFLLVALTGIDTTRGYIAKRIIYLPGVFVKPKEAGFEGSFAPGERRFSGFRIPLRMV